MDLIKRCCLAAIWLWNKYLTGFTERKAVVHNMPRCPIDWGHNRNYISQYSSCALKLEPCHHRFSCFNIQIGILALWWIKRSPPSGNPLPSSSLHEDKCCVHDTVNVNKRKTSQIHLGVWFSAPWLENRVGWLSGLSNKAVSMGMKSSKKLLRISFKLSLSGRSRG